MTLRTYRRYEQGAKQKSIRPVNNFARHYGVSLGWLFDGEGILNSEHVGRKATGKVAILPVIGPNFRRCEPRPIAMFGPGAAGPMKLDENGWRIPRRATQAHEIYLRCLRGLNSNEIADELSLSAHHVDVVIWRLRHPDEQGTCEATNGEHEGEPQHDAMNAARSNSHLAFVNTGSAAAILESSPSRSFSSTGSALETAIGSGAFGPISDRTGSRHDVPQ